MGCGAAGDWNAQPRNRSVIYTSIPSQDMLGRRGSLGVHGPTLASSWTHQAPQGLDPTQYQTQLFWQYGLYPI